MVQPLVSFVVVNLPWWVFALDNGVGRTPPMGYNTWDDFRCSNINASNIMRVADAFIQYDLKSYGYHYINIDDCWATGRNKSSGVIIEDPRAFPKGMKAVVDYVHDRGLKFGIYTDRGTATCEGRPGSQGFEHVDAETYASWGIDYLKEDSCNAPTDHATAFQQYGLMRDALNATGRHIFFALCGWSNWYAPPGTRLGNSWRYGYDVNGWDTAWGNSINPATSVARFAGPGAWNDPDALIGTSPTAAVHLTKTQSRTQFTLWAMMAAPLIIGSNILNLPEYDFETYTNKEVIAVDQDHLGIQGTVVYQDCSRQQQSSQQGGQWPGRRGPHGSLFGAVPSCVQIWTRQLQDGYAVAFVNYTVPAVSPVKEAQQVDGRLFPQPCNLTLATQRWNVSIRGAIATIEASSGDIGCWEVSGCRYADGSSVDSSYGCKEFPAPNNTEPCSNNMVWSFNKNGTITSPFSGLCFQADDLEGGFLAACTESSAQQWKLHGSVGKQQIVSADGQCITRGAPALPPYPPQRPGELSFNVSMLGWKAAKVRDLWLRADLGTLSMVTVKLHGDGDSVLVKLIQDMEEQIFV